MGMFDTISIYKKCPYCGLRVTMYAQTKCLSKNMYTYKPIPREYLLEEDDGSFGFHDKKIRKMLKVYPKFPYDKSHEVWENQFEEAMARAKLPEEFKDLTEVEVFIECPSHICKTYMEKKEGKGWSGSSRCFEAKIPVVDGYLIDELKDKLKVLKYGW